MEKIKISENVNWLVPESGPDIALCEDCKKLTIYAVEYLGTVVCPECLKDRQNVQ